MMLKLDLVRIVRQNAADVKKHRSSLNYRRAPGDDKRAGGGRVEWIGPR